MTVKFKVGFTMSAETLFGIIAKFLPVEDLHVEEVPPDVLPYHPSARLAHEAKPAPYRRRGINLDAGANGFITRALADGKPHAYAELSKAISAGGFAASGIGSKLERLREHGIVVRVGDGSWRLAEASMKRTA